VDEAKLTLQQAKDMLRFWRQITDERDSRVRLAYRSGLRKTDIGRAAGLARSTVDYILKGE